MIRLYQSMIKLKSVNLIQYESNPKFSDSKLKVDMYHGVESFFFQGGMIF